ncbi:hypothetical protein CMO90_04225 [Candidatus Woesearchaeota archaeon]|jgi:predicted AAA+ superfamily ATPase|nr:hypothetical protein [Candidatus Woesearchaeota archaeon]|tara:strand:+ start:377 stop:1075 length:699 start_codon:yes stop_codon:yes gene_type:complete
MWYEELGFRKNPLKISPFKNELVDVGGLIDKLNNLVVEGALCTITGDYGSGKTTLLASVIKRFMGKRKVIYYSCNRKESSLRIDELLYGRTWFSRLFKLKSKNIILLLDEINGLNIKEQKKILFYLNNGYLKSLVFVAKSKSDLKLNNELKLLSENNDFRLANLKPLQAVRIIRRRMNNPKFISNAMIKRIHKINPNPRTFLQNCEDVCRYAIENGSRKVNGKHVEILKEFV